MALPEFKSKEENRLSLCLFLYILTHHEIKRGGGILIRLKESYKEKPFLQMSFFFRSLSLSPLYPPPPLLSTIFYSIWSVYTLWPYLHDCSTFQLYTSMENVCACWVGTPLSLICLFLFPVKSDIHKKGLRSQHVVANAQSGR